MDNTTVITQIDFFMKLIDQGTFTYSDDFDTLIRTLLSSTNDPYRNTGISFLEMTIFSNLSLSEHLLLLHPQEITQLLLFFQKNNYAIRYIKYAISKDQLEEALSRLPSSIAFKYKS